MNRTIGALELGPLPAVIAVQAVLLAGLGVILGRELWPSDNPVALVPLFTLVFGWPTLVLFTAVPGNFRRTAAFAGVCVAVAVLLAAYVGWQATPVGEFSVGDLYLTYVATQLGAGFIALVFMQQFVSGEPVRYAALFSNAWRNLLVAGLSLALLAGIAILLALWAVLFSILGIDALAETFVEPWFFLPTVGIAFGVGTMLFRRRDGLVDGIVGLMETLARYLLPVVLTIVAVFLATLPFVTVGALWDTGLGGRILIALGAIAVLLICIAYRPVADLRYPVPVQMAVTVIVAVLPVLSTLALTGILFRVNQYGWTVSRCWAFTYAAILALFSLGYLWGVIRHRSEWPRITAPVNVSMAFLILAVLVLQNTPALDFRAISARSQHARVESGEIEAAQFDFLYAWRELARPGHRVAERLVADLGFGPRERAPDDIARSVRLAPFVAEGEIGLQPFDGVVPRGPPGTPPDRDFWAEVSYRPEPFEVPEGVREEIDREVFSKYRIEQPTLVRTELDGDPSRAEYVLLGMRRVEFPGIPSRPAQVMYRLQAYAVIDPGDGWNLLALNSEGHNQGFQDPGPVLEVLRDATISLVRPRYSHVRIGDAVYGLSARNWPSVESASEDGTSP